MRTFFLALFLNSATVLNGQSLSGEHFAERKGDSVFFKIRIRLLNTTDSNMFYPKSKYQFVEDSAVKYPEPALRHITSYGCDHAPIVGETDLVDSVLLIEPGKLLVLEYNCFFLITKEKTKNIIWLIDYIFKNRELILTKDNHNYHIYIHGPGGMKIIYYLSFSRKLKKHKGRLKVLHYLGEPYGK